MEVEWLQRIEARLQAVEVKLETLQQLCAKLTLNVEKKREKPHCKFQSMDPHLILMA